MEATVIKRGEKEHALILGGHELGVSKSDFDARFHMHAINKIIHDAYSVGFKDGANFIESVDG
jgi:hypothetical protein